MTKIKLCGMRRIVDIDIANSLKPDYVGFIFAKNRRRYIDVDTAKELKKHLDENIKAVGVFIEVEMDVLKRLINEDIIDVIQFHGGQDDAFIASIRELTDKPIIKAFSIKSEADIEAANSSTADLILLDSAVAGSGETFDWSCLKEINRDFLLAGGLNVGNIEDALRIVNPYGVDVSSGIEKDGYKDRDLAKEFVEKIRKEDNNE